MSHIELLVPFALPPSELAPDLLRNLSLPGLSTLLARASPAPRLAGSDAATADGFARALPHEAMLVQRFGGSAGLVAGGSPPIAPDLMQSLGLTVEPGYWLVVQPVHYHIARDHLVLTDARALELSEADAHSLFLCAQTCFASAGLHLEYGSPQYWFVEAERHRDLHTASPDAACGHNIDIWMPQGDSARAWRKLQNEVQMEWHAHAVNEARERAGMVPVNSLWLWGGADMQVLDSAPSTAPAAPLVSAKAAPDASSTTAMPALFGFDNWFAAFATHASVSLPQATVTDVLASLADRRLVLQDDLIAPALAGDWDTWRSRLQALDTEWFAPLRGALGDGRINMVTLYFSHGTALRKWSASRASLRKFWLKPGLARLLP
jgi:hypothetical protein